MKKFYLSSIQCIFQNVLLWGIKLRHQPKIKVLKLENRTNTVILFEVDFCFWHLALLIMQNDQNYEKRITIVVHRQLQGEWR